MTESWSTVTSVKPFRKRYVLDEHVPFRAKTTKTEEWFDVELSCGHDKRVMTRYGVGDEVRCTTCDHDVVVSWDEDEKFRAFKDAVITRLAANGMRAKEIFAAVTGKEDHIRDAWTNGERANDFATRQLRRR